MSSMSRGHQGFGGNLPHGRHVTPRAAAQTTRIGVTPAASRPHHRRLVSRIRNSLPKSASNRPSWQGVPMQEYRAVFRGGQRSQGGRRAAELGNEFPVLDTRHNFGRPKGVIMAAKSDKARHNRERRKKLARRVRARALRSTSASTAAPASAAKARAPKRSANQHGTAH
jgi:hypothetical protein